MAIEKCYLSVCFFALDTNAPKFFGFSEFLAGLALMVLAWTIADVRYRFRIRTSPLPLQTITFAMVAAIGVLTLLTDLWRAEQWLVPQGNFISPAIWQATLGGLFLLTFLSWAWFAFIRPHTFGPTNAKRYAQTLYRVILKGDPSELVVIADEFAYSARSLVRYATQRDKLAHHDAADKKSPAEKRPAVEAYANDVLLLIADKRFCRAIVGSSPGTALAIFQEIGRTKKYDIQVETFGKNIVTEALRNKDSFLFHEAEGYDSGLIGYHKPLSQAIFSNYEMVESIGTLLDPDMWEQEWDAAQWKAYCRIVLMTFENYVSKGFWNHSFALYRAKGYIQGAASDLYKIDGLENISFSDDVQARLRVVMSFIKDAVTVLEKKGVPRHLRIRVREEPGVGNFYEHLAGMVFEVIFASSAVRSPAEQCWWVQHNAVWHELFNFNRLPGPAAKVLKFMVRRLLYNEVTRMKQFPNFKGAKILGFCLNVMGLQPGDEKYNRDSVALHRVILSWTTKNFIWLHDYNPRVAEACLVDGVTYEKEHSRLVKTYPIGGLRRESGYVYLHLDQPMEQTQSSLIAT